MKNKVRILSILLAVMMIFTTGCKKSPKYFEEGESPIPESNIVLAENGSTEYKIVVPEVMEEKELVARDELVEFLRKSTGAEFPVISDKDLSFNADDKYLSVGKTQILATSGVAIDESELKSDGYKVVTKGRTVIMAGPSDYGTLYAAYCFLENEIGFKVYAEDEIRYETKNVLKLLKFNVTDIPDFEKRQLGYYTVANDVSYRDRMRVERHGQDWIYGSHSHFTILPYATYGHNEGWYSEDKTQLCLTNEDMRKEFVSRLKIIIQSHPDEHYILLGAEDHNTFCYCDNCMKAIEKYGTESGVDMVFVNKVARDINEWLAQTDPDRVIYIGTFAYHKTLDAPVKEDPQGRLEPSHPDVVAEDNVFVQFAPLDANFSYGFMDEQNNSRTAKSLKGWQVVCPTFCIWTYSANFFNYFVNFNNWGTQALQYQELYVAGGKVIYDMGTWDTMAPSFERLRTYISANLMWDCHADTQKMIDEFFENYYKDASPFLRKYYDLMRTYLEVIRLENDMDATCYVNYNQAKYWSKAYIDSCLGYFEEAERSIEHYKSSDPSLYESLLKRVRTEKVSVLFFALQFYQQTYTPSEQTAMIDEFEEVTKANNIFYWHEHTNLTQGDDGNVKIRIDAWRLAVGN